jgi:hypothetical protein
MFVSQAAKVLIRRYSDARECEVMVTLRDKEICLRCPDYDQALKWAWLECKSYGVTSIGVERIHEAQGGDRAIEQLAEEVSTTPFNASE